MHSQNKVMVQHAVLFQQIVPPKDENKTNSLKLSIIFSIRILRVQKLAFMIASYD